MPPRKKKVKADPRPPVSRPKIVFNARPLDPQAARRLSTAIDALLTEIVRQEMGRLGPS